MARGWLAALSPPRVHGAWQAAFKAMHHEPPFFGRAVFMLSTLISLATYSSTIDCLGLFFGSIVDDLGLSRCDARTRVA